MRTVYQKGYPVIKVDTDEEDIVQLVQEGEQESNVLQVERENIPLLIAELEKLKLKK